MNRHFYQFFCLFSALGFINNAFCNNSSCLNNEDPLQADKTCLCEICFPPSESSSLISIQEANDTNNTGDEQKNLIEQNFPKEEEINETPIDEDKINENQIKEKIEEVDEPPIKENSLNDIEIDNNCNTLEKKLSDEKCPEEETIQTSCKEPCNDLPKIGEPCNCGYNAPAQIDPACGWKMWIGSSLLYWQSKEKGLELGYHFSQNSNGSTQTSLNEPININFDYYPAFKINLGFNSLKDNWNISLEYLRYTATNNKSKDIDNVYKDNINYLYTSWTSQVADSSNLEYSYLKSSWKISYNIFDVEIERPIYQGKLIILTPHFGLRGGWLDQKYDVEAVQQPTIDDETHRLMLYSNSKQYSWIIGPKIGIDTNYLIGYDINVFGKLSGTLNYQKFKVINKQERPFQNPTTNLINESEYWFNYLTPNAELSLGIKWGKYFYQYRYHFDLLISYDFVYYWDQNVIRKVVDGKTNYIDYNAGDLLFHGLNISLKLNF